MQLNMFIDESENQAELDPRIAVKLAIQAANIAIDVLSKELPLYLYNPEPAMKELRRKYDYYLIHAGHILHLNLHEQWFWHIYHGEKETEFRECKPFWQKTFVGDPNNIKVRTRGVVYDPEDIIIQFSNGYKPNHPAIVRK